MKVYAFNGSMSGTCGVMKGKILGELTLSIDLSNIAQVKHVVYHKGWMKLGDDHAKPGSKIHVIVRSEPDPRFVFQFGGEPECSPVVYQIQGNIKPGPALAYCK
ncbi:hypothetical protein Leryth_021134 [Lithospermum erythrorhizon]|nr:hypothetical protein Leryth_021134 [Lithospermum erythrorhizon]